MKLIWFGLTVVLFMVGFRFCEWLFNSDLDSLLKNLLFAGYYLLVSSTYLIRGIFVED